MAGPSGARLSQLKSTSNLPWPQLSPILLSSLLLFQSSLSQDMASLAIPYPLPLSPLPNPADATSLTSMPPPIHGHQPHQSPSIVCLDKCSTFHRFS